MDFKLFLTVFMTVFWLSLETRHSLATLLFSSRESSKLATVFVAASLALVATTAIGVAAGAYLANHNRSAPPRLCRRYWVYPHRSMDNLASFCLIGLTTSSQGWTKTPDNRKNQSPIHTCVT